MVKPYSIILLLLLIPSLARAISVTNYSDATNDRFTDDASFIGSAYDFSGVGRSTSTSSTRWATLIGSNYFISAQHYHPNPGTDIRFYDGNSASGNSYTYTVAGGFQVGTTDLWIGYTESPIEASLARYGFSTTTANSLAETGLSGASVFMNGDTVPFQPGSPTEHVVGTNTVESFWNEGSTSFAAPQVTVDVAQAANFDQLITYRNLAGDNTLPVTTYESQLASGDSGSPLFAISGGQLVLVGTAFAVGTVPGNFIDTSGPAGGPTDPYEERDATFYNYIGSYESEINAVIAQIPGQVPEPSAALLCGLAASGLLLRRRR